MASDDALRRVRELLRAWDGQDQSELAEDVATLIEEARDERDDGHNSCRAKEQALTMTLESVVAMEDQKAAEARQEQAAELREALAATMIRLSLATGHGDTHADLLAALQREVKNSRKQAAQRGREGARVERERLRLMEVNCPHCGERSPIGALDAAPKEHDA